MSGRRKVLVLCTGNSARSQMTEGLVNHLLGESWEAFSAGTKPAGKVHPLAVKAMEELGIDISGHRPKPADEFRGMAFDLVVTVCDQAAENCPAWLGKGRVVHMGFPDPAAAQGGASAQLQMFRQVRDAIRSQLLPFIQNWDEGQVADSAPSLNFTMVRR